jgi:hypothetical protein
MRARILVSISRENRAMNWRTILLNWQGVLIRGDYGAVHTVALNCVRLIPTLQNPSEVALHSLRPWGVYSEWASLQIEVNGSRRPEGRTPSAEVVAAFGHAAYQSSRAAEVRALLAHDTHVALAVAASRCVGRSLFVYRFDETCSSGFLQFIDGRLAGGKIYGWKGENDFWRFTPDAFESRVIALGTEEFDYRKPGADGFIEQVGPKMDELFLSAVPVMGFCWRFQLMVNRELVSSVRPIREVDDRYFTAADVQEQTGFPGP